MHSTDDLWGRLQAGDERVLLDLLEQHFYPLRRHTRDLIRDQEAFRDIIKDALLVIWSERDSFRDLTHARNKLYKVVRNKTVSAYRRLTAPKQLRVVFLPVTEIPDEESIYLPDDESVERLKVLPQLYAQIDLFTGRNKEVAVLLYKEGKDIKTIARELGIDEGTVRVIKGRILQKLKASLPSGKGPGAISKLIIIALPFALLFYLLPLKKSQDVL